MKLDVDRRNEFVDGRSIHMSDMSPVHINGYPHPPPKICSFPQKVCMFFAIQIRQFFSIVRACSHLRVRSTPFSPTEAVNFESRIREY